MILITGGARSGKSVHAERLARERDGAVTYIATAAAGDAEMEARIAEHRERRPREWKTVEVETGLADALTRAAGDGGTILVDCLTLYLANLMTGQGPGESGAPDERIEREVDELVATCAATNGDVIIVSNEVGMGIVPDNPSARTFRDIAGRANQKLAAAADEVYLCVSGIPVRVK